MRWIAALWIAALLFVIWADGGWQRIGAHRGPVLATGEHGQQGAASLAGALHPN